MLTLTVPGYDLYDEKSNQFVTTKPVTLHMEHSLISLSKWEAEYEKSFLKNIETRTKDELIDYIRCMTIDKNVDPLVFKFMPVDLINQVMDYINKPMTASYVAAKNKQTSSHDVITNELIYYWMIQMQIPIECEKWHLNHLLSLINVIGVKNQPKGKTPVKDIAARNRELNAARKAKLGTKG